MFYLRFMVFGALSFSPVAWGVADLPSEYHGASAVEYFYPYKTLMLNTSSPQCSGLDSVDKVVVSSGGHAMGRTIQEVFYGKGKIIARVVRQWDAAAGTFSLNLNSLCKGDR